MKKYRKEKINELLKRELSEMIFKEIKDPRIKGFITVTGVEISKDLKRAKVYVTIFGVDGEEKKKCFKGLESSADYLKFLLKKRVRLRYIPDLEIIYDESVKRGFNIIQKLDEIKNKDAAG
jgi:ribosome-binding factor A